MELKLKPRSQTFQDRLDDNPLYQRFSQLLVEEEYGKEQSNKDEQISGDNHGDDDEGSIGATRSRVATKVPEEEVDSDSSVSEHNEAAEAATTRRLMAEAREQLAEEKYQREMRKFQEDHGWS